MITIQVTKRTADYHAQIKDKPELWDCGKNRYEAIGNLIVFHPEQFGIVVEHTDINEAQEPK